MRLANLASHARLPRPSGFALLLGFLMLTAALVSAQSFLGSISGTVTDPTGAVIPNTTVTLKSVDTGVVRTTSTNTQGLYSFAALAPGQYRITVEPQKFAKSERLAALSVSQQLRVDVGVSTQTIIEAVNVLGGAVAIQTQDAQLSNVVSDRQVAELPLLTRNAYDLVGLSAGAADGPDRGTGFQRGSGYAVNGQRSQSANFMLDGGENNDTFSSLTGQNVPVDSIQEFRVQTSNSRRSSDAAPALSPMWSRSRGRTNSTAPPTSSIATRSWRPTTRLTTPTARRNPSSTATSSASPLAAR
jgi:hypothetical protein